MHRKLSVMPRENVEGEEEKRNKKKQRFRFLFWITHTQIDDQTRRQT